MRKMLEIGLLAVVVLALGGCISEQARQVADLAARDAVTISGQYPESPEAGRLVAETKSLHEFMGPPKSLAKFSDLPELVGQLKTQGSQAWYAKVYAWGGWPVVGAILVSLLGLGTIKARAAAGTAGTAISVATEIIEVLGPLAKGKMAAALVDKPAAKAMVDSLLADKGLLGASKQPKPSAPAA